MWPLPRTAALRSGDTSRASIGTPALYTASWDFDGRNEAAMVEAGALVMERLVVSPAGVSVEALPRSLRIILESRLYILAGI